MSKPSTSDDTFAQSVDYLITSDEPLESRISAIENAVKSSEFDFEDILEGYAKQVSDNGIVFPSAVSELQDLHTAIQTNTPHTIQPLDEICSAFNFINSDDDVVKQALRIYNKDDLSASDRQARIKSLVEDAQRSGVNIETDLVINALKEYDSPSAYESDPGHTAALQDSLSNNGESTEPDTQLVDGIEYPDSIEAREDYVYRLSGVEDSQISSIDWYVGGTHEGTGKTLVHSFEFAGVYNISVEITDLDGGVHYLNEEVEVNSATGVDLQIIAPGRATVGKEVTLKADIQVENTELETVQWQEDTDSLGSGKEITHTFEDVGERTVTATANTADDQRAVSSAEIDVSPESDIDIDVEMPETVTRGEEFSIRVSIDTKNSHLEDVSCTIGTDEVSVPKMASFTVDYLIDDQGEYDLTIAAVNADDDSEIYTDTIDCHPRPNISLEGVPESVIVGDDVELKAEHEPGITVSWSVKNASLTSVDGDQATVTFNSPDAETATVIVEGENKLGDVDTEEYGIQINHPSVDTWIDGPKKATVNSTVEFTTGESDVQHAEIQEIVWEDNDGDPLGTGSLLRHTFREDETGEQTIEATIHTDHGVSDTDSITVTVQPERDVTAIAVVTGGPSTKDEFVLDASNSTAKNDEVETYKWEVSDGHDTVDSLVGESVEKAFESPGEYEVKLIVKTASGNTDTDTASIVVEEYTDVVARITGPDGVNIGERVEYEASETETVNTDIVDCQWYLNGRPSGKGMSFSQTFTEHGHYTLEAEVTTDDGSTDSDSKGISVSEPSADVTARFEVDNRVATEETIFRASGSEVEYGVLDSFSWDIDGESYEGESVVITFDEYRLVDVELMVESESGEKDSVADSVYILPTPDEPPYQELSGDESKTELLERVTEIYTDDELSIEAENWFGKRLRRDAEDHGIALTQTEVEAKAAEETAVPKDQITLDSPGEHIDEAEYDGFFQSSELEISEDLEEEPEGSADGDVEELSDEDTGGQWEVSGVADSPDDTESEEEQSDDELSFEVDDSVSESTEEDGGDGQWVTADESGQSSESDDDVVPELSLETEGEESDGKMDGQSALDDEDLLNVDTADPYEDLLEKHRREKNPPEAYDIGTSVFSMPNYAQDLMDFEFVFEEDDEMVPEGVNAAGIIVTEDDQYVGIARVEGRDWSIHTGQKQQDIAQGFESGFLTSIDSPVQILSIPTRFDIKDHLERVEAILAEYKDEPSESLMNYGRIYYPNWIEQFMKQNDMRERQFYIVIPLSAEHLDKFKSGTDSITEQLSDAPVIGGVVDRFTEDTAENISKYQILREINARMDRIDSDLRRIDVNVERITSRDEALSVLYHYYNDAEPQSEVFPMGGFTASDHHGDIGGVPIGPLLDQGKGGEN